MALSLCRIQESVFSRRSPSVQPGNSREATRILRSRRPSRSASDRRFKPRPPARGGDPDLAGQGAPRDRGFNPPPARGGPRTSPAKAHREIAVSIRAPRATSLAGSAPTHADARQSASHRSRILDRDHRQPRTRPRVLLLLEVDYSRLAPALPRLLSCESKWVRESSYLPQLRSRLRDQLPRPGQSERRNRRPEDWR
jgi:hypothetical protein